ncbi:adenylate kinase 9 isoform X1 [Sapajus apella]|uniref:Adenylate kinase 9 n=1 Tax=Sapajus apella TaxID=9515 RepID=A0A6J3HMU2_SAPAP|nr:adenylate kinase 9 isoform X1 [Sapajus apella]XP_032130944.1 adenylate kinase 9 isoform X1 [Sapajus apella]
MTSQEKTEEHPFADIFDEDETEKNFLFSKPVCFVVFGKPGVGKTTLAHHIAQAWKCIRVEALPILEEHIAAETELGVMLQSMLISGQSIPDELVIKLMLEKLNSPEVCHFGYIITEIPSLSQDAMTTLQQIELIKNLNLKPDIMINIKCPDYDLCQRISGQRQHNSTGYIYSRDQWDPEVIENQRKKKKEAQKDKKGEEEEEEEEQEEEEAFIAEMQMVAEILHHLVQRPEDYLENVKNIVKLYKETILQTLEEVMAEHNPQYLIELSGNKPPEELFTIVMDRLKYLNLKRAAVITKLQGAEEEVSDTLENGELFRTLASYKPIAPRYRWQRSKWGPTCPVNLKDGNIYSGLSDYSVSFLGKIYCLSSEEALKPFLLNPRPYLLPPMPAPPCKVFIIGPQYSGKTTLCNMLAENYKGKVVDYAQLVQPRFDKARERLVENTIAEATVAAIKVVKEKLLTELQAKKQAETTLREFQRQYEQMEFGVFPTDAHKSLEDTDSSINERYIQGSQRERSSSLEDTEEAKTKSENVLSDQAAKVDKDEDSIEEVTADHPEVVSMIEKTIKMSQDMNFEQPYEKYAEILQEVLREVMEENKDRFPGAPKYGGWIMDNCPIMKELWMVLIKKEIIPDLVIYLSDTVNNGKCLLNRIYLRNKSEIDSKILERLLEELQKKKKEEEAARKATEEELRLEEENQRLLEDLKVKVKEAEETDNEDEEEIEGDELEVHEEPEASQDTRGSLLPEESEASEVPESEPEAEPFQYTARELTGEDYEEETEDYQTEAEVDEELEEEEDEEGEDKIKERKRQLGDTKHFCPVVLKENFILQPGNMEEAAKYREKIYYFSSAEAKEKFLEHPEEYVAYKEPLKAPPLRVCLVGPHGSGKTMCGRQLAEKLNIFHIQFEEVLQEKLLLKTEKKVGPEFEEDSEDEEAAKQELEEFAIQANVKLEEENTKKQLPEVQLTAEEEVIKSSLMENEPLPPEILEVILSEWWLKEPIRSTGFILDGFPRYPEEAQFLGERGFFPDAAIFMQVEDQDIFVRLLPAQIEKWKLKQKKKLERKKLIKDMKAKIRADMIAKRRVELILEREKRRRENPVRDDEEISEEDLEEDDDDIENILEEEFPKNEEEMSGEEDEEQEADAIERLRGELGEKFEAEMHNLQIMQDELERYLIPIISINGARKNHIVQYTLNTKLKPLVENRASIFEKCHPIPASLAHKMLTFTYKYISSFGYWDPVKLSEGETIKPVENAENPIYPVIHRQYIYFLSSKETKDKFMKNPIKYIRQPKPRPTVPIRIIIVGPPKSGKTTVAKKITSEYGLKCISIGEALRSVLKNHPETELALMLNWHLHKGMTAPDELAIQALELSLMEGVCSTAGVVIDGYPVTKHQMNLLEARSIIPMVIFELSVPSKEIFKRLLLEKGNEQRLPYPLHNSAQIIAVRNVKYHKNIGEIRQYYQEQHQNWYVIDGFHSKWWVWNEVVKNVQMVNKYMQIYLERIKAGKAACIDKLCITPQELLSRLGEFGQFCPVSLAESQELFDCSAADSLEFAAEFRGHYYKMSSQEKLNKFLENPELYVPPLAPHPLPSADMIPKRLTLSELKSRFPKCAELQGYCPVTYQEGKQRQVLAFVEV